ncbi:MAG TPA: UDP-3-O-(3-hydroxymyristoyl)glucosamine N-acyltransferase [Dokdonella sp.]|uniref:UDP-3-O-(3-hydroxymyristoyl)glucosamine N-acyltransferase n=1 Tax=Dokdonella sp. TaxID=2291710 RepID=UPI002D7F34E6|nr:UDP-3-O-(3-hydroxymyristoyl)glucosamine N-acyltransferase [Dokdonella sp.]HET9032101.1 UDP-3-O-(3-hydroxymyristoyl)glucosamine N-acyltransferase [Dokdonella sp.]
MSSAFRLGDIAERFGLELHGDPDTLVRGVGTLAQASPEQLGFLANPRYRSQLASSSAAAVIVRAVDVESIGVCDQALLVAADPYVVFAKIAALFETRMDIPGGIHPSAVVDESARIAGSASVGAFCVVEANALIGDNAIIGAQCHIGPDCEVGAGSRLMPHVTLVCRVRIGQRATIHSGAVLGADGFGLAFEHDHWIKVPQLGGVRIGDDCEIGANTTIDRGALEDTVLENDVRLDNQIQIAHNVIIGAHTAIAGCAAIAGSTQVGKNCLIGGGAGIIGHLTIADRVTITAMSLVTHSIRNPGEYSSGTPIQEGKLWRRNAARFKHLDRLARQVADIEKGTPNE